MAFAGGHHKAAGWVPAGAPAILERRAGILHRVSWAFYTTALAVRQGAVSCRKRTPLTQFKMSSESLVPAPLDSWAWGRHIATSSYLELYLESSQFLSSLSLNWRTTNLSSTRYTDSWSKHPKRLRPEESCSPQSHTHQSDVTVYHHN